MSEELAMKLVWGLFEDVELRVERVLGVVVRVEGVAKAAEVSVSVRQMNCRDIEANE
jgi:hypothetical protein